VRGGLSRGVPPAEDEHLEPAHRPRLRRSRTVKDARADQSIDGGYTEPAVGHAPGDHDGRCGHLVAAGKGHCTIGALGSEPLGTAGDEELGAELLGLAARTFG
jgi:hypothetical protein